MVENFKEADWKYFRQLRKSALDRLCQRILAEISQLSADSSKSHHERYLAVYRLVQERDDELADAFNNPRRSTAMVQLARMCHSGLVTEGELAGFSDAALDSVRFLLDLWKQ